MTLGLEPEPAISYGRIAPDLAEEFPNLALLYTRVEARAKRASDEVRERLRVASDRFTGATAIALRTQPIPSAYRIFFRQIGIDPDERRTPVEALALERLRAGGFKSRDAISDAVLLATMDTGVALRAFDAESLALPLALRVAGADERPTADGPPLPRGRIVLADAQRAIAVLFGDAVAEVEVGRSTTAVVLCAVQVGGVPAVAVEEALWGAIEMIEGAH